MSSGRTEINEFVDATVLAARDAKVSQRFRIAELPRLAELVAKPDSDAELEARFHQVDGRCAIAGSVSGLLRAVCQRCLKSMDLQLDDAFHVVLVRSEEEMNELPDAQDSMIADAAHLDLAWLTEEQLLLAMPLVPLHADGNCGVERIEVPTDASAEPTQTPFARLRELMKKQ